VQVYIQVIDRENDGRDLHRFRSVLENDNKQSGSEIGELRDKNNAARLALAGVGNALWDLWARIENKPVWKLLVDMTPEQLASNVNFQYM